MSRFIVVECQQRTPEWHQARLGKLTSSTAADMLATHKDGKTPSTSRRNLLTRLVLERITGRSHENGYQSRAMEQGTEREQDAREHYEILTGTPLFQVGFLQHPTLAAGVSLDGYTGLLEAPEKTIEIKCPIPAVHLEYLKTGKVPHDYLKQMTHALWITGAKICDWMSYNPDFPEPLRAKLVTIDAEQLQSAIQAYEVLAGKFLAEVDEEEHAVRRLMEKAA